MGKRTKLLFDDGVDAAVGEACFDFITWVESGGIAYGLAVFQSDTVATTQQQRRVECLHFLFQQFQLVFLRFQTAVEQQRQTGFYR